MNQIRVTLAGMPSLELTDIAKLRLDSISFFLVILLLSAAGVELLWNRLARDISTLSRLSYGGALAGTVLWGLLFLFVLTMISGARELITPGAWKKVGLTYALNDEREPEVVPANVETLLLERRERLELLRMMLWTYAAAHEGLFPPTREESGIDESLWQQPGFPNVKYGYQSGLTAGEPSPLVFEYGVYGDGRMVLDTLGKIEQLTDPAASVSDREERQDAREK